MKQHLSSRIVLVGALMVVFAGGLMTSAERSSTAMASAATKFVGSLTPEQKQKGMFAFASDERTHWHFIPTGPAPMFPRNGLMIKEMTEPQRKLAHDLLKTGLSQRGYLTASSIMDLE